MVYVTRCLLRKPQIDIKIFISIILYKKKRMVWKARSECNISMGDILCFPYTEHEFVVNVSWRWNFQAEEKRFVVRWQKLLCRWGRKEENGPYQKIKKKAGEWGESHKKRINVRVVGNNKKIKPLKPVEHSFEHKVLSFVICTFVIRIYLLTFAL